MLSRVLCHSSLANSLDTKAYIHIMYQAIAYIGTILEHSFLHTSAGCKMVQNAFPSFPMDPGPSHSLNWVSKIPKPLVRHNFGLSSATRMGPVQFSNKKSLQQSCLQIRYNNWKASYSTF
jgi:hypothetical protein